MKVKITGREMKDASCDFISLVPRGANQIPFRIIKSDTSQENTMSLDITDIRRLFKREAAVKAASGPTILGVCVRKGEAFEDHKAALVAQGFSVGNVVEKADSEVSIFLQGGAAESDLTDVGMMSLKGDDVMVAVKGFSPWTDKLVSFTDKVQAQGFYMSIDSAVDVLEDTLFGVICDADAQKDLSTSIGDACDQFKAYALGLVKALPAAAFKTERALKMAKTPSQGPKSTNGDPKDKATQENGSQDPNVHQHGKGGEGTTAVNQDVMPASDKAKKEFQVIDPEALATAMKIEDGTAREEAIKALMLSAPVVQVEDGPGEGAGGVNGTSSDKPTRYVSAVSKAAKAKDGEKDKDGKAFSGAAKPFAKKDDSDDDEGGDDDATKAAKAERRAAKAEAARKAAEPTAQLPTELVDKNADGGSNPLMDALKAELGPLIEMVSTIKTDLDAVKKTQVEQGEQIVATAAKSEETIATALKGAVIGGAGLSTEQPGRSQQKDSARKNNGQVLDTAFGGKAVFGG